MEVEDQLKDVRREVSFEEMSRQLQEIFEEDLRKAKQIEKEKRKAALGESNESYDMT